MYKGRLKPLAGAKLLIARILVGLFIAGILAAGLLKGFGLSHRFGR